MIRLQFADEANWYAPFARWFSHARWSHVDIVAPDGGLIGARVLGVKTRPADYQGLPASRKKIVTVPCADEGRAWAFLKDQDGKPYDVGAYFAFGFARDWHDEGAWTCAELATAVLLAGGAFPHPLSLPKNKVTPGDLMLALSAIMPVGV